jgi:EAL domain-containing protein (putative c-di-GMP-specific phosphodiesterase class I)
MQRQVSWLGSAGLAVFAVIAIGCAAFLVMASSEASYVTAGAILVLALGQIVGLIAQQSGTAALRQRVHEQGRMLREMADDTAAMVERLNRLELQEPGPAAESPEEAPLDEPTRRETASLFGAAPLEATPSRRSEPAAPQQAPQPPSQERLDLLLEPVIELSTGVTAHYRARIHMTDDQGREIRHDELMAKAETGGLRPALDLHLLKMSMPVLRRLRIKTPSLRLLAPISSASLNAPDGIGQIAALLEINHDVAPGLVFDISQDDLGKLDRRGIEELARLSRVGVVFALSDVAAEGLELAALRKLGVRFLEVDAAALAGGANWAEFSSYARAMQFQIIGGAVANAQQASRVTRLARFACGPHFAAPRKVKSDAGRAAQGQRSQAA